MKFHVANANNALGSAVPNVQNGNRNVSDLVEHGNDVSYTENKQTCDKTWLR